MDKAEKQRILKELGGISEDIYDDLIQEFISQTRSEIAQLKSVLSDNDFDSVARIVHSIKGASANLRFTQMQEIVKTMEIAAKERKDKTPPFPPEAKPRREAAGEESGGSISLDKQIIQDCIAKLEEALEDIK